MNGTDYTGLTVIVEIPHLPAAIVGPGALVLTVGASTSTTTAPMTMVSYGSVAASLPSQQVVPCPCPRLRTTSKFGRISSHSGSDTCTQPQLTRTSATTLPFPRFSLSPQHNSTAIPRDGERTAARLVAKAPHAC